MTLFATIDADFELTHLTPEIVSMSESLQLVRGACPHDCPDTCAFVVTVKDGKAVDLRGDRTHSFTRGFLCQKVARYLDRVYHADRLRWPMQRTGPKGKGAFRRISWTEAIDAITERFGAIAAGPHGPQAILPYSYCGTMGKLQGSSLDRRFFHRLGASLLDRTICATAGTAGCDVTLGTRAVLDPEATVHARYIINWGSNTSVTNMHLWALMHQARKRGARIVTIDPYRSKTAARSDLWLPIRPGTDAALALGLMHVLFRDQLQDDDYLDRHCLGVDALKARALDEYPPDKVAAITGLTVSDIEDLAHAYATTKPALIRVNYGLQRHLGGGMAVRTIVCLPAIIGAWREVGGGALLSTSKLYPFDQDKLERTDLIPPGTRTVNMVQLAEALAGELPGPPVQALYVYNSNPAAVCPDQERVLAGLRREDLFTVVHEQFPTDTADYADIVLPATTQLEQFDLHGSYGHTYVQVNQPAIAPLYECKSNNDVFRLLAKGMGFEAELFDLSDEQLAEVALGPAATRASGEKSRRGVAETVVNPSPPYSGERGRGEGGMRGAGMGGRGDGETGGMGVARASLQQLVAIAFDGVSVDRLKQEGPIRLNLPGDYAPFAEGGFGTPSGKCEFYSDQQARLGLDPLPTYTPPHEDPQTRPDLAARFPLQLISPPAPEFLNSTFVEVEELRRMAGSPTVELHPDDAGPRNIRTGDSVRVFNDRGAFTARAIVGDSVRPGWAVAPSIWWNKHSPGGHNCNATTSSRLTDLGGGATFFDNLVQIAPESRGNQT